MSDGTKKTKREIDFDDLQNEMAGREVGRIKRFLSPETREEIQGSQEKLKKEHWRRLHFLLLHNPSYRVLYEKTQSALDTAQDGIDRALEFLDQRILKFEAKLEEFLNGAPKLPNGSKVFRTKSGEKAFTETGRELSVSEMALIQWSEESPTWQEYQRTKDDFDQALDDKEEVERYRDKVFYPARKRMNDQDNPPSERELEEILQGITDNMPEIVKHPPDHTPSEVALPGIPSVAKTYHSETDLNAPDISRQFETARLDVPDLELQSPSINVKPLH